MNTSRNKYDSLEQLIFEEGVRIQTIDIHKELDLLLIILNTRAILRQPLSQFKRLKDATMQQLENYELVGHGTGIHWPDIDEDLSLKGFLRNELKRNIQLKDDIAA